MRKRAGALYIKDKKLFLICEGQQSFYWTPGGGLEKNESFEQALQREVKEELNARLLSAKLYMTVQDKDADEEVRYFLTDMKLPGSLPGNTVSLWYTSDNYKANTVPISQRVYYIVYPKLVKDHLV